MDFSTGVATVGSLVALVAAIVAVGAALREGSRGWRIRRKLSHDVELFAKLDPVQVEARKSVSDLIRLNGSLLFNVDTEKFRVTHVLAFIGSPIIGLLALFGAAGSARGSNEQALWISLTVVALFAIPLAIVVDSFRQWRQRINGTWAKTPAGQWAAFKADQNEVPAENEEGAQVEEQGPNR